MKPAEVEHLPLFVRPPLPSSVLRPLSSVFCPLSSVLCPLSPSSSGSSAYPGLPDALHCFNTSTRFVRRIAVAITNDFRFFNRDQTAAHHFVEHRQEPSYLLFRVHDFD